MNGIGRSQKAARANVWTIGSLILAVGAAGPPACARPQTSLVSASESTIATPAEVPFKLHQDYAIVARGSVGQYDKLNFLIDTGSSSTVVDDSLVRKLHLVTSRREILVFGTTVVVKEAVLPSLQLGPLQTARVPVVVQNLSSLQEALSVRIDAIVGLDVLSRRSFTVDYEARKLIWGLVEPLPDTVTCDPRFPYPTVPLRIGDRTLRVFVDTGAQELALFDNLTGAIPGSRVIREEQRTTIHGPVVVKITEFQELTLGTIHWAQREGSLMQGSSFDGTMGPKWLGAKRISFDFEHKIVSWEQ